MDFIISAANIRAVNYGLKGTTDVDYIKSVLDNVIVPEFTPNKDVVIPANDQEANNQKNTATEYDGDKLNRLIAELPSPSSLAGFQLNPVEFEKDNDSNFHIDFITACSNLRASNYSIPLADRHKTKGIAGKIIPAMVTTTAMVTGLVCLELYKLIQQKKIESYRNSFVNLALPYWGFSEPIPPPKTKIREGWEWSIWDRFEFQGPMRLGELMDFFETKHELEITMASGESTMLYGFYMPPAQIKEKKATEIYELVKQKAGDKPIPNPITLVLCCSRLEDGADVDIPSVLYRY